MQTHRRKIHSRDTRSRGSVYILVLGASLIVAVIGVSALMAARVQRRAITASADMTRARENARTAIDWSLWGIKTNPFIWRMVFNAAFLTDAPFGGGTFTLLAADPIDGSLTNNTTDPVVLTGTGKVGQATYILEVTLNGDGTIRPGTWKRVVR